MCIFATACLIGMMVLDLNSLGFQQIIDAYIKVASLPPYRIFTEDKLEILNKHQTHLTNSQTKMTTYTLNVVIDNAILAMGSMDSLCIAKKVFLACPTTFKHRLTS